MYERPYDLVHGPGGYRVRIRARGNAVLASAMLNRGTAFTEPERRALGLTGLLPSGVTTLASQLERVYAQYGRQPDDLARNVFLGNLRDRNEVLFYRLLSDHLEEMLPIVYTPTVGQAIERFSQEFRRTRGVYLSVDEPEDVEQALSNYGPGPDDVDLIVATDAEGILGIGDQGVGGMDIAVGKLAVYTAAAGLHPRRVIPVMLDVGTDNLRLLNDDMYLGSRHARVRDQRYDDLIDAYVTAATKLFPHAMLHWEDFGAGNARRILEKYADQCCTFNDDLQGTAATALAAVYTAMRITRSQLCDQRVVIHGAGTAGLGIADMMCDVMVSEGLTPDEATGRCYAVDADGLLGASRTGPRYDFQARYARSPDELADWPRGRYGGIGLAEVVEKVAPTILIGTSAQSGAFTEQIVKSMAARIDRPIIMPLSNPTSKAEAHPADLIRWTDGRALVAAGSPFPPVDYGGHQYRIAQANNALVFPGIGLGVTVARARRISVGMISAAANAIASLSDLTAPGAALLPPVDNLRLVSATIGVAVAQAAAAEGLAGRPLTDPIQQVHEAMWRPEYPGFDVI
jgi:malate dehydrogenase (oxaloacetate-decarboxylating)